jgi:hypothetical protein
LITTVLFGEIDGDWMKKKKKLCICFEQSLSCTDLCPCQAGDLCRNKNTHLAIFRNTDEDDDI